MHLNDLFSAGNVPPSAHIGLRTPYLRDNASSSYWALFYVNNHSHLSWDRFQEEMIRLFDNTNAHNEILMSKTLEDIHSLYCGPSPTTLDEYILAFRNIEIQVPDLPFRFKFFYFKQPLPSNVSRGLIGIFVRKDRVFRARGNSTMISSYIEFSVDNCICDVRGALGVKIGSSKSLEEGNIFS